MASQIMYLEFTKIDISSGTGNKYYADWRKFSGSQMNDILEALLKSLISWSLSLISKPVNVIISYN